VNTAQQCRLLAAKARVKALAVPVEADNYLAIAREYEALAATMEAGQRERRRRVTRGWAR